MQKNDQLRDQILEILKQHENSNLASEAAREQIAEEILQVLFDKK